MIVRRIASEPTTVCHDHEGKPMGVRPILRLDADAAPFPDCFLVEQSPDCEARSHFHKINQFQVAVRGMGKLGRYEWCPISIQYLRHETGDGPILANEGEINYVTWQPIRIKDQERVIFHLPEAATERVAGYRAFQIVGQSPLSARRERASIEVLIEPQASCLGAC